MGKRWGGGGKGSGSWKKAAHPAADDGAASSSAAAAAAAAPPPPTSPHTPAQLAYNAAHKQAHALRAAAEGITNAHLASAPTAPGPGFSDILLAEEGATRFLAMARARVRADHVRYKAERVTSGTDPNHVYFLTLHRLLHSYERKQRRSTLGRQRNNQAVTALHIVEQADVIITPQVPAKDWARRSRHTAYVVALGKMLPQLALKAHVIGRRLVGGSEDFTTQQCPHCGYCEARGSALFLRCTQCGLASHRDAGMAPNGIFKRALVHGEQARQGLLAVLHPALQPGAK